MKKMFLLAFIAGLSLMACWPTDSTWRWDVFIDGIPAMTAVNFYQEHIPTSQVNAMTSTYYNQYKDSIYVANSKTNSSGSLADIIQNGNGMMVSLPMTIWFIVKKTTVVQDGVSSTHYIDGASLYYKIIPKGLADDNQTSKWRLAKTVALSSENQIHYDIPIKLFGENTLTEGMIQRNGDTIQPGDSIILLWVYEYGLTLSSQHPTVGTSSPRFNVGYNDTVGTIYNDDSGLMWYYTFDVMKVIYSGRKTPRR